MKSFKFVAVLAMSLSLFSCAEESVEVVSLSVSPDELSLIVGETHKLSAAVFPEDAVYSEIVWSSSNESVASVGIDGLVTAVSAGDAVIYAAVGDKKGACDVSVSVPSVPVESVVISEPSLEMQVGDVFELSFQVNPENADYSESVWSSSDVSVASVEDGKVTALAEGTAEIMVTVEGVSASCAVTVIQPLAAAIGDFYYSDGTWSSELDNSKTVIGVVFYIGNPAENDATLAREHPGCVNGLAVSLGEMESAWQSGFTQYGATVSSWVEANTDYFPIISQTDGSGSDYLNKIVGYNNTLAIEAFNDDAANAGWPVEVVEMVEQYREDVPAPTSSSGWYLPSAKELSLLCTGEYEGNIFNISATMVSMRDFINGRLDAIEGALRLCSDPGSVETYYYSSSEYDMSAAFHVDLYNGYVYCLFDKDDYDDFRVRPVLAF